jgi:hypothetical protein
MPLKGCVNFGRDRYPDGHMIGGKPQIAWILGAGFSRPLGGPLLGQLLSPGSFRNLKERHVGNPPVSNDAEAACHVYHYGRAYADGGLWPNHQPMVGERLWDDAEEFLDLLDSASAGGGNAGTIRRILATLQKQHSSQSLGNATIPGMATGARRLIAAECSHFVEDATITQERWAEHIEWVKLLDNRHTVVTFNYDRVLDRITDYLSEVLHHNNRPAVLLPGDDPKAEEFSGRTRVYKLHGSVDWERMHAGIRRSDRAFALTAQAEQMVIATPGPTKAKITTAIESLWARAIAEISVADAVVFLGYRFPPTDGTARRRLLGAIEEAARRRVPNQTLHLHVVLGPNSSDAPRLIELLRLVARRAGLLDNRKTHVVDASHRYYRIHQHQLYSQDFFTVYSEGMLTQ